MTLSLTSLTNRLHLRHFRLLIALDDFGSLKRASEHIGLTQPGASKCLAEVEAAVGAPLFIRTNRGIRPNDLGYCIIRYARLIQGNLIGLLDDIEQLSTGRIGKLSVGVIMGAVPFVSGVIVQLRQSHPAVSVEIIEDTSSELLQRLYQGELDVAVCRSAVGERPDLFESFPARAETLAVVANRDNPLAERSHLDLADLVDAQWVVYTARMPMRLLLEREFQQNGLPFPRHLVETRSALATLSLLHKDPSFVALLSSDVAEFFVNFGIVGILPIFLASKSEPYEIVTLRGASLPPLVKGFVETINRAARM